jgi:hypothetical protein
LPEPVNRRADRRLLLALRGLPMLRAAGAWRGWHEAHVVVGIGAARGRVLSRRFRQHGFLLLRRGQPVRLVVLDWQTGSAPSS